MVDEPTLHPAPSPAWRPAGAAAALTLLVLALATLAGCNPAEKAEAAEKAAAEQAAPVTVAFAAVERGSIDDFIVATSTVRAAQSADVSSEVPGLVEDVAVEEGAWVKEGQVLARVDYRELELAERKARAQRDKTAADLERAQALAADGLLAREALETDRFEAETAQLGWNEAQVALQKATVRAPITGVIAERATRLGDRVNLGQKMFTIVDTRRLEADLHVPERFLDDLRAGQRCLLTSETRSRQDTVEATVLRVAPVVDAESGTVKVVVGLEAEGETPLRPGQFVRAQLVTVTHADAVLVPRKAVVFEEGQPLVFVREGDVARALSFEPGLTSGEHVEALSGIEPETLVVVAGQAAPSDGTRIQTAAEALAARDAAAEAPTATAAATSSAPAGT